MQGDADEDVADAHELAEVEARAVELGHQGAAAVHDDDVGDGGGRGGEDAHVGDAADAEEFLDDGLARKIRGGRGGGQRERFEGSREIGEWDCVVERENGAECAAAGAGAPGEG